MDVNNVNVKALVAFERRHGLRASEVGLLRTGDLDFRRLRIHVHRLKGSLSRVHPLQPDEARLLKAYLRERSDGSPAGEPGSPVLFLSRNGNPIDRRTLDYLMRAYARVAKLPREKRHFHVLKHSIATHLLEAHKLPITKPRKSCAPQLKRLPRPRASV